MRLAVFLFCLIATGFSFAQNCVPEGEAISLNPQYARPCCQGLVRMDPPPGLMGSGGTCHKKVNDQFCYGEGKFRAGWSQLPCCQGLTGFVINPQTREFECRNVPTCVEENQQIVMGPGRPMVCCEGLQPKLPPSGMMGGATCVKPEYINCLDAGSPVFQYPGAMRCCPGLVPGKAATVSPVTFSEVCVRPGRQERVNNTEQRQERKSFLREDPAETSVSEQ